MSKWKCEICGTEFKNFHAQGFEGKIYCPLCYFKKENLELQRENQELRKQLEEMKAINNVLSKELTSDKMLKQDYLITCYGIPINEIPKLAEENKKYKETIDKAVEYIEKHLTDNGRFLMLNEWQVPDLLRILKEVE